MQTLTTFYLDGIELPVKIKQLQWQLLGLVYTATGYGSKIPTQYMVQHNGIWKRVYCRIFSNIGSLFIVCRGQQLYLTEYDY